MEGAQVQPGGAGGGHAPPRRPGELADVRIQGLIPQVGRPVQGKNGGKHIQVGGGDIALVLPVMVVVGHGHRVALRMGGIMGPDFRPLAPELEQVPRSHPLTVAPLQEEIAVFLPVCAHRDRLRPAHHRPGIPPLGQVGICPRRPFPLRDGAGQADLRPKAGEVAVFPDERRVITTPAPVLRLAEMLRPEGITAVRRDALQLRAKGRPLAQPVFPSH